MVSTQSSSDELIPGEGESFFLHIYTASGELACCLGFSFCQPQVDSQMCSIEFGELIMYFVKLICGCRRDTKQHDCRDRDLGL